jgi:hypothetical protein
LWLRDHTQRHTTLSRTHLDEWSGRRRHLYLTTHITHKRKTFMPPPGRGLNPQFQLESGRRLTP